MTDALMHASPSSHRRGPRSHRLRAQPPAVARSERIEATAVQQITADLVGASPELLQFFDIVFWSADRTGQVAKVFGVHPETLKSRFYHAGLPSPKQFLVYASLCRAARMLENPALSVPRVADLIGASSGASLRRTIRLYTGLTTREFRQRYDGAAMLLWYRERLVLPYVDKLVAFNPLSGVLQCKQLLNRPDFPTRFAPTTRSW